jgi:mono/diheme cytochrome c family protein
MPSFARVGDAELAVVASYTRTSWGNQAGAELGALAARSP